MKKNSKLGWIKITKKSKVQANKFEKVPFAQHFIKKFDRLLEFFDKMANKGPFC